VFGIVTFPVHVHVPASTVMVSPSFALLMAAWIAEFVHSTALTVEGRIGSASNDSATQMTIFFIIDLPYYFFETNSLKIPIWMKG
jgi:hypothetical protein